MVSSNCVICGYKKLRFMKEQEVKVLLSTTGKILLLGQLIKL